MLRLLGALGYLCGELGRIRIGGLAPLLALLPSNLFFVAACYFGIQYSVEQIKYSKSINHTPDTLKLDELVGGEQLPATPRYVTIEGELNAKIRMGEYAVIRDKKTNKFLTVKTRNPYDTSAPHDVTLTGVMVKIPNDIALGLSELGGQIKTEYGLGFELERQVVVADGVAPPSIPLWSLLIGALGMLAAASLGALRFGNLVFIREGLAQVQEIDEYQAPDLDNSGLRASGRYLEAGDPRPALDLEASLQTLSNGEIIVNASGMGGSAPLGRLVGKNVEIGILYCGFGPPRQALRINGGIVLAVRDGYPLEKVVRALGSTPESMKMLAGHRSYSSMPGAA
jgi:hypothetical protein